MYVKITTREKVLEKIVEEVVVQVEDVEEDGVVEVEVEVEVEEEVVDDSGKDVEKEKIRVLHQHLSKNYKLINSNILENFSHPCCCRKNYCKF